MAMRTVLSTDAVDDLIGRDDVEDPKTGGRDDVEDPKTGGRDDVEDPKTGGRDDVEDPKTGGRGAMDVFQSAVAQAGGLGGFLVFAFVTPVGWSAAKSARPRANAAERVRQTQVAKRGRQRPAQPRPRRRYRTKR